MRGWQRIAPVLLPLAVLYLFGCSKNPIRPVVAGGPQTELTYAPPQSDTTTFRVHLYWNGWVDDGEITRYRIAVDGDTTQPILKWHATSSHDSEFTFLVRPGDNVGGHVFWVSAEARDGRYDPTPAKRFFSIRTLPPTSRITSGPVSGAATASFVTFSWSGTDPDGGDRGDPAPVDSFEYILLRPGTSLDGNHSPLPNWAVATYATFLSAATGAALPAPYDDWKWSGTAARSNTFAGLLPGVYMFAVRAVDAAGAHDSQLRAPNQVRTFTVASSPDRQSPPRLVISSDTMLRPLSNLSDPYYGSVPVNFTDLRIPLLDNEEATFLLSGQPGLAGYPIAGFSFALDDTTNSPWYSPSPSLTSVALPAHISSGRHNLYIRATDAGGGFAVADLVLDVAHAAFQDPGQPSSILYVDDFAPPPGDWNTAVRGSPNFPADDVEDDWWTRTILAPIAAEHGMTVDQWDAVFPGREPPPIDEMAKHRAVIWYSDFGNLSSSPSALFRGLHESGVLRAYVRAGGTLILTGFNLAAATSLNPFVPLTTFSSGICSIAPSSANWAGEYFVRGNMGVDGVKTNDVSMRYYGARDFVEARVTSQGIALGFQSAAVDTGAAAGGAKWDPLAFGWSEALHAPGLPKIEGWRLATFFGCAGSESEYRRENPGAPIATPLLVYHGVDQGLLQNLGPSPREGLVCGVAVQAHDDGHGDASLITPETARHVTGRMVFLGFPIYYMKDAQALQVMRAAFAYVNASPTLPAGTP